mmetsp:Transcript_12526/g.22753  ORF Transcript_12526/g.22753 Transcript_12526/m.22753 type:complete len:201 (-) Transcript_12526:708-1310(-)
MYGSESSSPAATGRVAKTNRKSPTLIVSQLGVQLWLNRASCGQSPAPVRGADRTGVPISPLTVSGALGSPRTLAHSASHGSPSETSRLRSQIARMRRMSMMAAGSVGAGMFSKSGPASRAYTCAARAGSPSIQETILPTNELRARSAMICSCCEPAICSAHCAITTARLLLTSWCSAIGRVARTPRPVAVGIPNSTSGDR